MITAIATLAIAFTVVFGYPFLTLRPIIKLARSNPAPSIRSKYSMTDLFALMFLIQIPFAIINFSESGFEGGAKLIIIGLMCTMAFLIWLAGLRAANHIGVASQIKRIVVIGYTLPAATVGGIFTGALLANIPGTTSVVAFCLWSAIFAALTLSIYLSAKWVIRDSVLDLEQRGLTDLGTQGQSEQ